MENVRNRIKMKLVNNKNNNLKSISKHYTPHEKFDNNLAAIRKRYVRIRTDEGINVQTSLLLH